MAEGKRKINWKSELMSLVIVLAAVTVARSSLADHYYVPSGSMEYSLMPGDRVIVDKTAYGVRIPLTKIDMFGAATPRRGDIAVFDSPRDGVRLIKRIVAIGGDSVSLVNGQLTINGQPLGDRQAEHFGDRNALLNLHEGGGPDIQDMQIPPGKVLAIGDHRGNSLDARFWGLLDERELYGRAIAIYYRSSDVDMRLSSPLKSLKALVDGFVWKPL
jgi:signal peptidase I